MVHESSLTWYLPSYSRSNLRFCVFEELDERRDQISGHCLVVYGPGNLLHVNRIPIFSCTYSYLLKTVRNHIPYPPAFIFKETP